MEIQIPFDLGGEWLCVDYVAIQFCPEILQSLIEEGDDEEDYDGGCKT